MFKLRSMRLDAEAATGPVWTADGRDPRITRLGCVLRTLHLDELPQLFNVLRGDMSMIGPRPERPEFVGVLEAEVRGYMDRLAVLPGVTGLAQINLPPDTDLDSVRRKLVLDREYITTAGLLLDIRIVICTLLRAVGIRGGYGVRLMRLHRHVALPTASSSAEDSGQPDAQARTPDRLAVAAATKRVALGKDENDGATSGNGNGNGKRHDSRPASIRDTVRGPFINDTKERPIPKPR